MRHPIVHAFARLDHLASKTTIPAAPHRPSTRWATTSAVGFPGRAGGAVTTINTANPNATTTTNPGATRHQDLIASSPTGAAGMPAFTNVAFLALRGPPL